MRYFIICVLLFISCTDAGKPDSANKELASKDSASNEPEEPNPQIESRRALIESYSHPLLIDTGFTSHGEQYKVLFKYYCTMDSGITVPALYNFDTREDFLTHNFKSQLILVRGNDTVTNKTLDKLMFNKLLYPELKSYAILLPPYFYITGDTIKIDYSISIPATDVGIGASIKFDTKGNYFVSSGN